MSDEGMTPMSDDSVANIRRLATDKLQRGEPVTTSGTPWLTLLARLDVAEREREAFAERVFRHGFSDGWTANQKGRLAASASVDEAWHFYVADGALQKSVALTANHSAQEQEQ